MEWHGKGPSQSAQAVYTLAAPGRFAAPVKLQWRVLVWRRETETCKLVTKSMLVLVNSADIQWPSRLSDALR